MKVLIRSNANNFSDLETTGQIEATMPFHSLTALLKQPFKAHSKHRPDGDLPATYGALHTASTSRSMHLLTGPAGFAEHKAQTPSEEPWLDWTVNQLIDHVQANGPGYYNQALILCIIFRATTSGEPRVLVMRSGSPAGTREAHQHKWEIPNVFLLEHDGLPSFRNVATFAAAAEKLGVGDVGLAIAKHATHIDGLEACDVEAGRYGLDGEEQMAARMDDKTLCITVWMEVGEDAIVPQSQSMVWMTENEVATTEVSDFRHEVERRCLLCGLTARKGI